MGVVLRKGFQSGLSLVIKLISFILWDGKSWFQTLSKIKKHSLTLSFTEILVHYWNSGNTSIVEKITAKQHFSQVVLCSCVELGSQSSGGLKTDQSSDYALAMLLVLQTSISYGVHQADCRIVCHLYNEKFKTNRQRFVYIRLQH